MQVDDASTHTLQQLNTNTKPIQQLLQWTKHTIRQQQQHILESQNKIQLMQSQLKQLKQKRYQFEQQIQEYKQKYNTLQKHISEHQDQQGIYSELKQRESQLLEELECLKLNKYFDEESVLEMNAQFAKDQEELQYLMSSIQQQESILSEKKSQREKLTVSLEEIKNSYKKEIEDVKLTYQKQIHGLQQISDVSDPEKLKSRITCLKKELQSLRILKQKERKSHLKGSIEWTDDCQSLIHNQQDDISNHTIYLPIQPRKNKKIRIRGTPKPVLQEYD